MGLGYWTSEDLVYNDNGELLSDSSWDYYVPMARDIPHDLRVYFRKNSYTSKAIFGSKSKIFCAGFQFNFCLQISLQDTGL